VDPLRTRELTRLVERPTAAELFTQIEERGDGVSLTTEQILDAIRRGREER
jgi:hypothetical protein